MKRKHAFLHYLLWCVEIGRSLLNKGFLGEAADCDYDTETKQVTLYVLPDDRAIEYSECQLKMKVKGMSRQHIKAKKAIIKDLKCELITTKELSETLKQNGYNVKMIKINEMKSDTYNSEDYYSSK